MSNTFVRSSLAIAYEISADSKGNCSLTIRGAARALGVNESSIRKQRIQYVSGCGPEVQKNLGIDCPAKVSGCGPEDETQISDSEFAWLMKWYGFLSPRGRTDEARKLLSLVLDIGVRGWMQAEAGHNGTVQELVQSVKIDRLEIEAEVERQVLERMSAMDKARSIQIAKIHSDAEERIQLHIAESAKHTIEYQDVQLERLYRQNLALKATIQEKYSIVRGSVSCLEIAESEILDLKVELSGLRRIETRLQEVKSVIYKSGTTKLSSELSDVLRRPL